MTVSADENRPALLKVVGVKLEAVLQAGEELLECTTGKISTGIAASQEYCIGLTSRRFVFLHAKNRQRVYSLYFPFIGTVSAESEPYNLTSIHFRLHPSPGSPELGEIIKFKGPKSYWNESMQALVEKYTALVAAGAASSGMPSPQQAVQQVAELRGLEAPKAALVLLEALMNSSPFIAAEPGAQQMLRSMRDTRLADRVAAGIFAIVFLFTVIFASLGLGEARFGCGAILVLIAIVNLVRGNPSGRQLALFLSILNTIVGVGLNILYRSPLDVFAWIAFGTAMLLLLAGKPGRKRIYAGSAAFAIGWVGAFAFAFVSPIFFPNAANVLIPGSSEPFFDNFSTDQDWYAVNNSKVAMGMENGAYAMLIKQGDDTWFSFPPVAYFPSRAEVDVLLPGTVLDPNTGLYGLICRYQENPQKYYMAYIDPLMEEAGITRMEGNKDSVSLAWKSLEGLKDAGQPNRIGLTCQNNLITLTVNGVQKAQASDPEMAQFGDGDMALFASTYPDVPAGGFKVLFDNASFWP